MNESDIQALADVDVEDRKKAREVYHGMLKTAATGLVVTIAVGILPIVFFFWIIGFLVETSTGWSAKGTS